MYILKYTNVCTRASIVLKLPRTWCNSEREEKVTARDFQDVIIVEYKDGEVIFKHIVTDVTVDFIVTENASKKFV